MAAMGEVLTLREFKSRYRTEYNLLMRRAELALLQLPSRMKLRRWIDRIDGHPKYDFNVDGSSTSFPFKSKKKLFKFLGSPMYQ